MPFSKTQLEALDAIILQGVSSVRYQDREVRYQDIEKLMQLREKVNQAINQTEAKSQRIYAQFNSGL